jgi:hypothetical protein
MLSTKKALVMVGVLVVGFWFLSGPGPSEETEPDAATGDGGCGTDFKDTIDGILSDPKACLEQILKDPQAGTGYARAYFTYDQGRWTVAAEPYNDPLVTDYGVNAVSNGDTLTVTVEALNAEGDSVWTGQTQHGELALLIVDFADLPGADRIVVTGDDGQSTEVRM